VGRPEARKHTAAKRRRNEIKNKDVGFMEDKAKDARKLADLISAAAGATTGTVMPATYAIVT